MPKVVKEKETVEGTNKPSRNWCFTINNPTVEELTFPEEDVKYLIYQLEQGENETPHFQGYVELTKPRRLAALKKWGEDWARAHFETRKGSREQAKRYCEKLEGQLRKPVEYGDFGAGGQGARSDLGAIAEVIRGGGTMEDIAEQFPGDFIRYHRGIEKLRETIQRGRRIEREDFVPKPWQQQLLDIVNGDPDPRKIHWWVDITGNEGKTYIARYLMDTRGAYYASGGKHDRILASYNGESIVIFDFPREMAERVPYPVLEHLKNGIIPAGGMYGMGQRAFGVPHVLCFSNFNPDLTALSADRWDVQYLGI